MPNRKQPTFEERIRELIMGMPEPTISERLTHEEVEALNTSAKEISKLALKEALEAVGRGVIIPDKNFSDGYNQAKAEIRTNLKSAFIGKGEGEE